MEERVIVLCPAGDIDGQVVEKFLEQFTILDAEDGPIKVIICSDGGWVAGGIAIYEAIRTARNHVTTVGMGTVGSIAVLCLQAGDKRVLTENTVVFLHEISVHFEGDVTSARGVVAETERLFKQYCDLVARESNVDANFISGLCKAETHLTATEALGAGLIDEVLSTEDVEQPQPKKKKGKKK